ncbi:MULTISPECIES: extracellular solute-binding protein [Hungatella]|uniref:ABC transporter substrate-binding protein n=1 Tax=Hungatella TaxID=1649459 RepID=UPI00210970C8|nr:extracellular solute-binding protein [Hungatella sp. SL.1.14]MCQ4828839.1 extracellular solute-binding protein [Hungatella sp. SL.1.14]
MRRRQVMKKAAAILLTAAVAAGLTACGSKPSETQSTAAEVKKTEEEKTAAENGKAAEDKGNGEAVTLTMWVESKNETDIKQELDEEFMEENPDIILNKVMKEGDPGNDFYQGVAAGNAPDCVTVSFTLMDKYANAGILAPLNQYFDQWDEKDGFSQSYVDMFTKNGNLYGITSIDANLLMCDKEVIEV